MIPRLTVCPEKKEALKMANRININTDGIHDKLTRQLAAAAINFNSDTHSSNRLQTKENPRFDDLILSLTNAHENLRARQVTEWERMRRYNFPLSV